MKAIGYLIVACVLLAIIRALAVVLVLMLGLALLVGIITKPRETFGLLAFAMIAGLVQEHPIFSLLLLSITVLTSALITACARA